MSTQLVDHEKQGSHWYQQDGTPAYEAGLRIARKQQLLPSVTSILGSIYPKPGLERWKNEQLIVAAATTPMIGGQSDKQWADAVINCSREKVESSALWGKTFHSMVDDHYQGRPARPAQTPLEMELEPFLSAFIKWSTERVSSVIGTEQIVTHPTLGYAGRYDLLLLFSDGESRLCDIKSRDVKNGKPLWYDEQPMQLGAYADAMEPSQRPEEYMSIVINRLTPETPYTKVYTEDEMDVAQRRWLACLELWQQIKKYRPEVLYT